MPLRHVIRGSLVLCLLTAVLMAVPFNSGADPQTLGPDIVSAPSSGVQPPALRGAALEFRAQQIPGVVTDESVSADFMDQADRAFGIVNGVIGAVFFFDVAFWSEAVRIPFIVIWLVIAGVFLTLRMGFINVRGFRHALQVVTGRYTDPREPGDVSHFQALSTALSATVGLGNIAGVAIAIMIGGPGATFWMIVAGLIGMTTKFTECTLGQMYRDVTPDGQVLGGPVRYLSRGLAERGLPGTGKFLAVLFALLCIGGSFGGGNSFQVNQSLNAIQETAPWLTNAPWAYGLIMTVLTGIVIVGGIRRIANVTAKLVPFMSLVYLAATLVVIATNFTMVPAALVAIVTEAFSTNAAYGGFIGVLVTGFQRAAFSNEAGSGSAAIAHSAARTKYPIREGFVSLLEPFIDTVLICTMTALVINITGAYNNPAYADLINNAQGAALTSRAFSEYITWFPYVLSFAVFLFAFSTMISWSYYGERCAVWLFGQGASNYYKAAFLLFTFLGSIVTSTNILDFGDLMILAMTLPNLLGVYLLQGKVRSALTDYWNRLDAGEYKVVQLKASRPSASM
jgi:AGCS family alanine or glycine:cation symporter